MPSIPQMGIDLRGRVRNMRVPTSRPLIPLFEAVVNSFQALEHVPESEERQVTIFVERAAQEDLDLNDGDALPFPETFIITDNGVGFNDVNFQSFCTSDSTYKEQAGGKGVGRFAWLKAFQRVCVESVYETPEGNRKRSFTFSLREPWIKDHDDEKTDEPRGTRIRLEEMGTRWQRHCPKRVRTIGSKLIEHTISWFVHGNAPRMSVSDGQKTVDVSDIWLKTFQTHSKEETIRVRGKTLKLYHLRLYKFGSRDIHSVSYCAHGREVIARRLSDYLPSLPARLQDNSEQYLWKTFVAGEYLDDNVSSARTEFDIPEKPERTIPLLGEELPSFQEIRGEVTKNIKKALEAEISAATTAMRSRVEQYIAEDAPQYRHVLALRPDSIAELPAGLSQEALDTELHKLAYDIEKAHRNRGRTLLDSTRVAEEEYEKFVDEENEIGKSALAKYIAHRRRILELLSRALRQRDEASYELEDAIHRLIFPLRSSSDEVHYADQNLWVVDERLTYHYYLASDKKFRSMEVVDCTEQTRPDIVVFNRSFALSEGDSMTSVVIIEFKRPMRKKYDEGDDNPISQVYNYVRSIREGKALDRDGRHLPWRTGMPFYCYILCDLTQKLRTVCENFGLTPSPDSEGYFGHNPQLGAYTEVISYDKLVKDARRRNRVFFDKLGFPK